MAVATGAAAVARDTLDAGAPAGRRLLNQPQRLAYALASTAVLCSEAGHHSGQKPLPPCCASCGCSTLSPVPCTAAKACPVCVGLERAPGLRALRRSEGLLLGATQQDARCVGVTLR